MNIVSIQRQSTRKLTGLRDTEKGIMKGEDEKLDEVRGG